MKPTTLAIVPVILIAAACGGSGGADTSSNVSNETSQPVVQQFSDADILAKAYDPDYSVPEDFFVDERAATSTESYTVHHVLDESNSYERCTDDLVVAQAWEQADNDARAVSGYYVTSVENDRYFEFVRELSFDQDVGNVSTPTSPGYARIFKCRYANRDGVDRTLVNGYSGRLSAEQIGPDVLREFTEYLWQFRFFNVSRKVVIDSASDAINLQHTLLLAFVINQGNDRCDRVDVVEWHFSADAASGEVMREFDNIRSFEAQSINGVAEICP